MKTKPAAKQDVWGELSSRISATKRLIRKTNPQWINLPVIKNQLAMMEAIQALRNRK